MMLPEMRCMPDGAAVNAPLIPPPPGSSPASAGGPNNALTVSAVIRFRLEENDENNDIPDVMWIRGCGYAVLVSGRLR